MLGKHKITYIAIIILLILFLLLAVIALYKISENKISNKAELNNKVIAQLKQELKLDQVPDAFKRNLDIINSTSKSDEEKYQALRNLLFYYSTEYSRTHDPKIRDFAQKTLGEYAEKNFEKYYLESDFLIPCADPSCGSIMDKESEELINKINSSGLKDYQKETIIANFKTASYIPPDGVESKKQGMSLVISQLTRYGDPVASSAASDIKKYLKAKHNIEL